MGGYLGLFKASYKVGMQYRFDFFVGLIRIPLTLIILYYFWQAIFAYNGVEMINGYTFETMIAYYALSMIVSMFTFTDIDNWIRYGVKSGEIVNDYLMPLNFIWIFLYTHFGTVTMSVLISLVPTLVIAYLFIGLIFVSWLNFLLFIVSLIIAMGLLFLISLFVGLLAFWLTEIRGIIKFKQAFIIFFSGGLIPLSFFPEIWQKIFAFLPFQYLKYVPINIYLGIYSIPEIWLNLGIMFIWLVLLYLIVLLQSKFAFKRLTGVGI
tara:strand:+ start:2021 stop:2815 length:795 start_codon:yes stop_codon:yes gene_type:complete